MKDRVNFEKNNSFFWLIWDYSAGLLLAFWVFLKSMWDIWKNVPISKIIGIWQTKKRKKIIREGRKNLGNMKTSFFNRNSQLLQHFCQNVTNAAALDDVYNSNGDFCWPNSKPIFPLSAKVDPLARFYLNCPNGQAVRNRYRGVGVQFEKAVKELLKRKSRIRILSIACGSAQSLVHKIAEMSANKLDSDRISLVLTDMAAEPLELARKRALEGGIINRVSFVQTSFQDIPNFLNGSKYDIIEACGIFDYLPAPYMLKLLKLTHSLLNEGGCLIASNMNKTRGARILTWTYNWEIIYRTPKELSMFLKKANFQKVEVFTEPWKIHLYAVARKDFNGH